MNHGGALGPALPADSRRRLHDPQSTASLRQTSDTVFTIRSRPTKLILFFEFLASLEPTPFERFDFGFGRCLVFNQVGEFVFSGRI